MNVIHDYHQYLTSVEDGLRFSFSQMHNLADTALRPNHIGNLMNLSLHLCMGKFAGFQNGLYRILQVPSCSASYGVCVCLLTDEDVL